MASPNTSPRNKGFTLVEILVALALLVIIFSFGLFISFDFYKSYAFGAEKSIIVSVLQKARSQSLNNINQAKHGVRFEKSPGLKYIIFEGSSYDPNNSNNITIGSSFGISITNPVLSFEVVFDQLSGNCITSNCSTSLLIITVSDGTKSYDITLNSEGRINW